jgi:Ni/Co efflux regulator RcnB
MKATLIALAALSLFTVATPASAQDGWRDRDSREHSWRDRDHGWRDRDWRRHHRSGIRVDIGRAYARGDCSVKVTKIHRPNGTVVTRRVRSCDY